MGDVSRADAQPPDPLIVMRKVVEQALFLVPAADGAVVELAGLRELTYVCASGSLKDTVGTRVPIEGSLSGLALRTGQTLACDDSETDPRVDREATRLVGAVSMLCVPLRRGSEVVGVMKLTSTRRDAFDTDAVDLMHGLAGFISDAIAGWADLIRSSSHALATERRSTPDRRRDRTAAAGEQSRAARVARFVSSVMPPGDVDTRRARHRIEAVLAGGAPDIVFQPIIDLKTGRLAGCEALARFTGPPVRGPEAWFAEAHTVGLGADLELAAIGNALRQLAALPAGCYLALNLSPQLLGDPRVADRLAGCEGSRLVLELTEHDEVSDFPALSEALLPLRATGARLAIDDTGAGFAGFSRILKLSPDLIKLDRVLTTGIDTDPARQALAGALVNFATATGAHVIAEGIETAGEFDAVRELGISYGQGYHLGRPAPANKLGTTPALQHQAATMPKTGTYPRKHYLPRSPGTTT